MPFRSQIPRKLIYLSVSTSFQIFIHQNGTAVFRAKIRKKSDDCNKRFLQMQALLATPREPARSSTGRQVYYMFLNIKPNIF